MKPMKLACVVVVAGTLAPGQVVLVDDGRCPAGQVMRVTDGDHVKAGGKKQVERQRTCVKK